MQEVGSNPRPSRSGRGAVPSLRRQGGEGAFAMSGQGAPSPSRSLPTSPPLPPSVGARISRASDRRHASFPIWPFTRWGRRAAVQSLTIVVTWRDLRGRPPACFPQPSRRPSPVYASGSTPASSVEGRYLGGSSPSRAPLRDRPGARPARCSVRIRFPAQARGIWREARGWGKRGRRIFMSSEITLAGGGAGILSTLATPISIAHSQREPRREPTC